MSDPSTNSGGQGAESGLEAGPNSDPSAGAEPVAGSGVSRRGLLGLVGAGAAGVAIGAGAGVAGGLALARAAETERSGIRLRFLRRTPGGHHHARAGPPALRRVRHDGPHRPRGPDLAAAGLDICRGAHDSGAGCQRDRRRRRIAGGAAGRHGRGDRPRSDRAHHHLRIRPDTVRERRRRPVRNRRPTPCRARTASRVPRRRPRSRRVRWRPVHPGVRRRPAGRGPRDPQPQPHRLRARAHPVVADGLRAHVAHDLDAADAPQPVRLQGRHREHPRRRSRRPRRARVGRGIRRARTGWRAARTSSPARSRC